MALIDQLPRLSAFDPGAVGEGGLDPLGLGAIADRIANVLVPGVRARMYQPRFVTMSAVGAIAYQTLHGLTADQGKTTADIAFEWLVVEGLVRHSGDGRSEGVPGSQKAARAKAAHERLSRRTYLSGPRVFGFTGVYRPFSRDASVLAYDDLPAENAARLVNAWELDYDLPGYVSGISGTPGGRLRREITDVCRRSLEKGECAAAPGGQLLRDLSDFLAPRGARENERRVLRELIATGEHAIRNELATKLIANPPPEDMTQRDLAGYLMPGATTATLQALQASFAYEEAATALDYAFRRFLAFTTQQHGCMIDPSHALQTPGFEETATRINDLVQRAIASVAELDDDGLSSETAHALRLFERRMTPGSFLEAIIQRHEEVQAGKKKLSWLDQIDGEWTVRLPYRNQSDDLNDEFWTHPMRVETLARFLRETA
ncbi:hypothetical protein [Paraburkholderia kururiensis]|uniref:hypothetical protein n=1 Tax=Paraburkholderia kururiensis TaxID=984307 RepID=UPI0018F2D048|nr:hypothetical protein [Paraburkholderia kururiensis]